MGAGGEEGFAAKGRARACQTRSNTRLRQADQKVHQEGEACCDPAGQQGGQVAGVRGGCDKTRNGLWCGKRGRSEKDIPDAASMAAL